MQQQVSCVFVSILFSVSFFSCILVGTFYPINKTTVNQLEIWNYCCSAFPAKALLVPNKCKGARDSHLLSWRAAKLPTKPRTCSWIPHLSRCCAGSWPLSVLFKWRRAEKSLKEEMYNRNTASHSPQHYVTTKKTPTESLENPHFLAFSCKRALRSTATGLTRSMAFCSDINK